MSLTKEKLQRCRSHSKSPAPHPLSRLSCTPSPDRSTDRTYQSHEEAREVSANINRDLTLPSGHMTDPSLLEEQVSGNINGDVTHQSPEEELEDSANIKPADSYIKKGGEKKLKPVITKTKSRRNAANEKVQSVSAKSKAAQPCATDNNANTLNVTPESFDFDAPQGQSSPVNAESCEETGGETVSQYHCPFQCGLETSQPSLMQCHIMEKHTSAEQKSTTPTVKESNEIRKTFMENTHGITVYKFNKLISENCLQEVKIPGNGYCYISALLITLAEQGVYKDMPIVAHEIMTEIRNHVPLYRKFDTSEHSSTEEQFLTVCSDYFQRGEYSSEVVDVCVGATANALGVNLNIVNIHTTEEKKKRVSLSRYDCDRYKSELNLFLHFHPGSKKGKNLDAHYTCYVN